jgi:hypothetical protein
MDVLCAELVLTQQWTRKVASRLARPDGGHCQNAEPVQTVAKASG